MGIDSADDGAHIGQLCGHVGVDEGFEVRDAVAEPVHAVYGSLELKGRACEVGKRSLERFVPNFLLACVVASGKDESPCAQAHCCEDVFVSWVALTMRSTPCRFRCASTRIGYVAAGDSVERGGGVE